MLLTKEVEILVTPSSAKYYSEKGYIIPIFYNRSKNISFRNAIIKVKTEDLSKGSHVLVDVKCDYCGEEKNITHKDYMRSINANNFVLKYACQNCNLLKKEEIKKHKQSIGVLERNNKGYWSIEENRINELHQYVEKYKYLDHIDSNKDGKFLAGNIRGYEKNGIKGLAVKAGYNINDLYRKSSCKKVNRTLDDIIDITNKFIKEYNRFPTQFEYRKILKIPTSQLNYYGGINKIKDHMNYSDENDLIDDRGFRNRSLYEYMTAQYLIFNNIPYKREQNPFYFDDNYKNLRSDFTFYLLNKEIHVEVWGLPESSIKDSREFSYSEKRKLKEELYKKYNIELISIDYEIFQNKYEIIQDELFKIFNPYLNLKYKYIEQSKFISPNKLSDEDLLNELMKYSDDINILPKQEKLEYIGLSGLYLEVLKRYSSYYNFAKKFNKYTYGKYNEWNKESIIEAFIYMLDRYGKILKTSELRNYMVSDRNLTGIIEGIKEHFINYIDAKLYFYLYCNENNIKMSFDDLAYLSDLINCKNGFNKKTATKERITTAKIILNNIKEV